jgi:AhpC/TSA family
LLEELRRNEADRSGLDVILISVWEGADTQANVEAFCELWDFRGTVLLDESGDYARALGIRGVPTNVVVDSTGIVRAFGASDPRQLEREAAELIGDSGSYPPP